MIGPFTFDQVLQFARAAYEVAGGALQLLSLVVSVLPR